MENPVNIAAVVLNYNDADATLALLEKLRYFNNLAGIVVVDNASQDTSRIRIKEYGKDKENIHPVFAKKNGGYGSGNNLGIRYARKKLGADLALVCNPDISLMPETLDELVLQMKRHGAQAAAPRMVFEGKERRTGFFSPAFPLRPWFLDLMECDPILRRLFARRLYYKKSRLKAAVSRVDCLWGSLVLLDIDAFLKVGGFDEAVFLYKEETILGHRLKAARYRTILCNRIFYGHRGGESIEKSSRSLLRRQRLREKSTLYYYRKYLRVGRPAMLFSRLVFRLIEAEVLVYRLVFGRDPA